MLGVIWNFLCVIYLCACLASTADYALSPALSIIVKHLKVAPAVAGATFLALGNGAPDVFSSVAGAKDPSTIKVGVCALIGGVAFVVYVVIGAVIYASTSAKNPYLIFPSSESISRDIIFLWIGITLVLFCGLKGSANVFDAVIFLATYVTYVAFVFIQEKRRRQIAFSAGFVRDDTDEFGARQSSEESLSSESEDENDMLRAGESSFSLKLEDSDFEEVSIESLESKATAIEFSVIRDSGLQDIDPTMNFLLEDDRILRSGYPQMYGMEQSTELGSSVDTAPSLSGAAVDTRLRRGVLWTHMHIRERVARRMARLKWAELSTFDKVATLMLSPVSILRWLSVPNAEQPEKSQTALLPLGCGLFILYYFEWLPHFSPLQLLMMALFACILGFWLNTKLHEMLRNSLSSLANQSASISYGVVNGNQSDKVEKIDPHLMRPYEARVPIEVEYCLGYISFLMGVMWISLLADSLMSWLEALGEGLSVEPEILGITLLAWGNSMGDLAANLSVARRGLAEMAVTGCFAAPAFNLLFGIPVSILVACGKSGVFKIDFDIFSPVNGAVISPPVLYTGSLVIGLPGLFLLLRSNQFKMHRRHSRLLIGLYIVTTLLTVGILYFCTSNRSTDTTPSGSTPQSLFFDNIPDVNPLYRPVDLEAVVIDGVASIKTKTPPSF